MPDYAAFLELSTLDGSNGFKLSGAEASDYSGRTVSTIGDFNGDGFDDVLIGAPFNPYPERLGASYVVFGHADSFAANINLSALDGNDGFKISGVTPRSFAARDSLAGDVNGDGFDDLIIGAPGTNANGGRSGAAYVVFGHAGGSASNFDLSTLDGTNGFKISGSAPNNVTGFSASSAGDINGDGFADVIVGAPYSSSNGTYSGTSYVVFGHAGGFAANIELSALNGTDGFTIKGASPYDSSGISVASAGDVNGDGFDDLIIGAFHADPHGESSGASYVVFGHAGGFPSSIDLSTLNGTDGFTINGVSAYDDGGTVAVSAGDVNGDGIDDLIIAAPRANENGSRSGAAYVVFGHTGGFASSFELSALNGTNGFKISGVAPNDQAGFAVSGAGDVNGDGFADVIVGAPFSSPNGTYSGTSYVLFGKAGGFAGDIDLSTLDGNNGFAINGELIGDHSGGAVSSAGDVNGDGFSDLIVGARQADPNGTNSGASYVIFGSMPGEAVTRMGTAVANTIHGGDFNDRLYGRGGDDTLIGHNGNDSLNGGPGADTMIGGTGNDIYNVDSTADVVVENPNEGSDTVRTTLQSYTLGNTVEKLIYLGSDNFTGIGNGLANYISGGVGNDDLRGGVGNDKLLGGDGNDLLTGESGADMLTGGSGNDIFVYDAATDSSSTHYDTIMDFNYDTDVFDLPSSVAAIDTALTAGALNSGSSFNAQLTAAMNGHLAAHDAELFTPDSGTLSGQTFLIVDVNGTAGYQAGHDLVIHMVGATGTLTTADFT